MKLTGSENLRIELLHQKPRTRQDKKQCVTAEVLDRAKGEDSVRITTFEKRSEVLNRVNAPKVTNKLFKRTKFGEGRDREVAPRENAESRSDTPAF